ncbi:hypothetical protein CDAR_307891, partial [Caerostris darwini]
MNIYKDINDDDMDKHESYPEIKIIYDTRDMIQKIIKLFELKKYENIYEDIAEKYKLMLKEIERLKSNKRSLQDNDDDSYKSKYRKLQSDIANENLEEENKKLKFQLKDCNKQLNKYLNINQQLQQELEECKDSLLKKPQPLHEEIVSQSRQDDFDMNYEYEDDLTNT